MIQMNKNEIVLTGISYFDLSETLSCGQFFRYEQLKENTFQVVAGNKALALSCDDDKITFHNTTKETFENIWSDFFDIDTDYTEIMEYLFKKDDKFKKIASYSKGIRILRQDPWEALCSFIISQNNNIPRIQGIIKKLCENFGEKIENTSCYSFPKASILADKSPDDLAVIRSGFRAKYIIDAAKKVANKDIDLTLVNDMPLDNALSYLMKIKGVGIKVAMCSLLYGFNRLDAFPQDVWIKRAMSELYDGKDFSIFGKYAGVAQQYIFHYIRTANLNLRS